jgi:hypothetical protein
MDKNKYVESINDYKRFKSDWDKEVADQYKKKVLEGDNDIVLIHRKCYTDLQKYHQELKDKATLEATAGANQELHDEVAATLHDTSMCQPLTQHIQVSQPVQYSQVQGTFTLFRNPLTLNANVAITAFQPTLELTPQVPWTV